MGDEEPKLNDHGEPIENPRPEAGVEFDPVARHKRKLLDPDELSDREKSSRLNSTNENDDEKSSLGINGSNDQVGKGFNSSDKGSAFSRLRGRLNKNVRRRTTIAIVATSLGFGGFAGFAVLQGPLQFIHFAQNLRKFHMVSNEEFGDNRGSRVLIYALYGAGRENTRLGVLTNATANKWEKNMIEKTGMKPIYSKPAGRHIGFEIVDDKKAQGFLDGTNDSKKTRAWNKVNASIMGDKAEIVDANQIKDSKGTTVKSTASDKSKVVSLARSDFSDRRAWIKTMGREMGTNRIVGIYGSRLLKKRGGVDFHPMNKITEKLDDKINKTLDDRRKKTVSEGSESIGDPNNKTTDANGNQVDKPQDAVDANGETKKFIEDFKNSGAFKTAKSAAIVVGVLCAARSFGNGIEDYKYANNYLPQMRMGVDALATGNQIMSGDSFNMKNLQYMNQFMYDQNKKTSFAQGEAYVAESGGTGGVPMPKEASVKNVTDKPLFFDILDKIPIGAACDIQSAVGNIWGIKQVLGVINDGLMLAIDTSLKPFGTSTNELLLSALKAVSGTSVDPLAKGADFGNMATAGTFFASNDEAIAMGGSPLTPQQTAELKSQDSKYEKKDNASKTLYARYVDPLSSDTLVASGIDSANVYSFANVFTNLSVFNNIFKPLTNKVSAATSIPYDYGVPKYGFALSLQKDERFEDPYENAKIVEDHLDDLNGTYGECFGTRVTKTDTGIQIESDKSVNVFKMADKCKNNTDEMFLRYRFYLADAISAMSLVCNDGDENACAQIGEGEGPAATNQTQDPGVDLQTGLNNIVNDQQGEVSVSVEELGGSARSADVKGNTQVITASLYKLLSAYTILKKIQSTDAWNKNITVSVNTALGDETNDVKGTTTVKNCFEQMILISSDTCGRYLSNTFVSADTVDKDLQSLGLKNTKLGGAGDNLTTTNDLVIYLKKLDQGDWPGVNKDNMNKLIDLMKRQDFRYGIPDGTNKPTADKVGWLIEQPNRRILNDAGIVYSDKGTYVLAILTKNNVPQGSDKRVDIDKAPVWQNINNIAGGIDQLLASSGGGSNGESTKPIPPLDAPSDTILCPTETPSLGKIDLYLNGVKKPANICKLPNVKCTNEECNGGYGMPTNPNGYAIVNSRVAGAWYALVEAAKKDGITITTNSSLRTNQHQRELCLGVAHSINADGTCKSLSDLVASQGFSPHEGGYAMDIQEAGHTTGGQTCSSRASTGTATYNWLKANASKFGIYQYSAESWHWDANPLNMSNRC